MIPRWYSLITPAKISDADADARLPNNDQRAVVRDAGLRIVVRFNFPFLILNLDNRPFVDEQSRNTLRFGQRTAAVESQIDDDDVDTTLFLEIVKYLLHVARGASEVCLLRRSFAKVAVKGGNVDHADTSFFAVEPFASVDDFPFHLGRFQLNRLTDQRVFGFFAGVGLADFQVDFGSLFPANVLNDFS